MSSARLHPPRAGRKRAWLGGPFGKTLRLGAQLLAVALATAWLSRTLAELSGTALRLPPPWGQSVQTVILLLGLAVFAFARHVTGQARESHVIRAMKDPEWAGAPTRPRPTKQERFDAALARARSRARAVGAGASVALVVGALGTIAAYKRLHEQCAWSFTVPIHADAERGDGWNWYWAEWGEGGPFPCEPDAQRRLLEELDGKLPRFLERASNTVYLPSEIPGDVRALLEVYGDGDLERGKWTLLHSKYAAPMRLIDEILRSRSYPKLMERTRLQFLLLHALVIALLACAAGVLFAPAPRLATELLELVQ